MKYVDFGEIIPELHQFDFRGFERGNLMQKTWE